MAKKTTNKQNSNKKSHKVLGWVLLLGLLLMASTAMDYFMKNPSLIQHTGGGQVSAETSSAGNSQNGVMALMQTLQENPSDVATLLALAQHFTHTDEWARAENFAMRAVMVDPQSATALYWLGVAQHGQGRFAESAASLEKSLLIKDDPDAQYSLGILYAYYLKQPSKAREAFAKAVQSSAATASLKAHVEAELKKLDAPASSAE